MRGAAALLLALVVGACGSVADPLQPLDPGQCFYCGPPGCGDGPWVECDVREALESKCSGHAACGLPPGKVGYFDAGHDARDDARGDQ